MSNSNIGMAIHAMSARYISEFIHEYPMKPARELWSFSASQYADSLTSTVCRIIDCYFQQVTQAWYTERYKKHRPRLFLEYPLRTNRFKPGQPGRADAFMLTDHKCWIWDLKTGAGPSSFDQLAMEALAIIYQFRLKDEFPFELTIVQPMADQGMNRIRSERWSAAQIKEAYWGFQDYPVLLEMLGGSAKERIYMVSE